MHLVLLLLAGCATGDAPASTRTLAPSLAAEMPPQRSYALDGEVCRTSDPLSEEVPLDCAPGLVCCYPCAIPNCQWRCEASCGSVSSR